MSDQSDLPDRPTPPVLTEREREEIETATRRLIEAQAARAARGDRAPANEKFSGPVFVDADGEVQTEPSPEVAARHAEYLRKSEHYARLRAGRDAAD